MLMLNSPMEASFETLLTLYWFRCSMIKNFIVDFFFRLHEGFIEQNCIRRFPKLLVNREATLILIIKML
jgi:hypothetical protein